MKHIVAMRFCSWEAPGVNPFEKDKVEFFAKVCRDFTVKSLLNMRNKDFIPVFLMHPTKDLNLVGPILPSAADLDAAIVRYNRFPEFCKKVRGTDDLIVTRCDSDDLYANWVVDDIQEKASRRKDHKPFVYGYSKGLLYRVGTNHLRLFEKKYGRGHFSAFQSLVYGKDARLDGITPYSWPHNDVTACKLLGGRFTYDEIRGMLVHGDGDNPPFIWTRTGNNVSHDGCENDLKYPETGKFGKGYVKEKFGVDLPIA